MSYMHIGQHGACDPAIIHHTDLATEFEYADLKRELESNYDYEFEVIKRNRSSFTQKRIDQLQADYYRFRQLSTKSE